MDFIRELEDAIGKKAKIHMLPMQPGDVPATWADVSSLFEKTNYRSRVGVHEGVGQFVQWYRSFYHR